MVVEKKIVLVTGANRGIGLEVCRQLLDAGHRVILTSRNAEAGHLAVRSLNGTGKGVAFHPLDVTNQHQIELLAEFIKREFGRLDVLINNAAILANADESILDTSTSDFYDSLKANLLGVHMTSKALIPLIPSGGSIINVSSGAGSMSELFTGWAPAYSISKTALNALTRHMAFALLSKKIRVNAVCPGWVRTDMGGRAAPRSVNEGADTIVWLANGGDAPSSGRWYRDRKTIDW